MSDMSVYGGGSTTIVPSLQGGGEDLSGVRKTEETSQSQGAGGVSSAQEDTSGVDDLVGAMKLGEDDTRVPPPNNPRGASHDKIVAKLDGLVSNLHVDIGAVMKLMFEMSRNARQAAREERQANLDMRMSSLSDAAQKLREAAAERWKAGLVSGITQIGAGAVQGVGGVVQLRGAAAAAATDKAGNIGSEATATAKAATNGTAATAEAVTNNTTAQMAEVAEDGTAAAKKLTDAAQESAEEMAEAAAKATDKSAAATAGLADTGKTATKSAAEVLADPKLKMAEGKGQVWQAAGQFIQGSGKLAEGHYQQEASLREAEKADADRVAELYENARQRADEQMKLMLDMINDIKSMMQSIESSRHETAKNIVRA